MKKKFSLLLCCFAIATVEINAKSLSGIYMNTSDYKNNKLAYQSTCNSEKHNHSIYVNNLFWDMPKIIVHNEGKKYYLLKDSIFGYKDCDNNVFRFYKNQEYKIVETSNMYIYTRDVNTTHGKGFKIVTQYYFSKNADSEILPLVLENLKDVYKNNIAFIDLLDMVFTNPTINIYDNTHNTFKINYLYSKTIK